MRNRSLWRGGKDECFLSQGCMWRTPRFGFVCCLLSCVHANSYLFNFVCVCVCHRPLLSRHNGPCLSSPLTCLVLTCTPALQGQHMFPCKGEAPNSCLAASPNQLIFIFTYSYDFYILRYEKKRAPPNGLASH